MTPATKTTRVSLSSYRGKPIVVTVRPSWLEFRLLGTRKTFTLDIEAAYQRAAFLEAEKERRDKAATRKAKRRAR